MRRRHDPLDVRRWRKLRLLTAGGRRRESGTPNYAGLQLETRQERVDHLRFCPVCHGLLIEFLKASAIQPAPLVLAFTRVSIARPTGGRLTLSLDREGYLYAIDSQTNQPEPVPVSQLVRTETDWYATDGYHWEGPLISCPGTE